MAVDLFDDPPWTDEVEDDGEARVQAAVSAAIAGTWTAVALTIAAIPLMAIVAFVVFISGFGKVLGM